MVTEDGKKSTDLRQFIGSSQMTALRWNCRGQEGRFFQDLLRDLDKKIAEMPVTYDTDGMGDAAPVTLHYFLGASDWYIVECDKEAEQHQAFGFACLNGDHENAELGYISIADLIDCGVELDLYYAPETIGIIKDRFGKRRAA